MTILNATGNRQIGASDGNNSSIQDTDFNSYDQLLNKWEFKRKSNLLNNWQPNSVPKIRANKEKRAVKHWFSP
jgi:hypothetical protein